MRKLSVSGYAHAKIQAFRHLTSNETTGYGVFDEDFNVVDFVMLKHEASVASVEIDGEAEEAFVMQRIQEGSRDYLTALWWHTHPGPPTPSGVDEKQFEEMQAQKPVAIMLIYGSDGKYYARLAVSHKEFTCTEPLQVEINHSLPWGDESIEDWKEQIKTLCVAKPMTPSKHSTYTTPYNHIPARWWEDEYEEFYTNTQYRIDSLYASRSPEYQDGLQDAWDEYDLDIPPLLDGTEEPEWFDGYDAGRALLEGR